MLFIYLLSFHNSITKEFLTIPHHHDYELLYELQFFNLHYLYINRCEILLILRKLFQVYISFYQLLRYFIF